MVLNNNVQVYNDQDVNFLIDYFKVERNKNFIPQRFYDIYYQLYTTISRKVSTTAFRDSYVRKDGEATNGTKRNSET
jgi:hypothetical protein